tara:strand:+ start:6463 stop:6984 length:522 start_codon:yes stop_codon:yes gene_type:complete
VKNTLLIIIFSFVFVGCATTLKIESDSDQVYDLSSYKSFKIETSSLEEDPSQIGINPIFLQRASRSIESSLSSLGLVKSTDPDLIVRFFIATEREVDRSQSFSSWYRRGYYDDSDHRYYRVDKDALTIRFHDAKSEEVVWYAFSRFKRSKAPKEQEEVDNLIEQAMASFKTSL